MRSGFPWGSPRNSCSRIGSRSASGSEIVSACLQDHKRAVVVGERSWGKGSVQNIIELESGASALKLTTAGYKRPSGKNIHRFPDAKESDEWGVMPDEKVRFTRTQLQQYDRYRRDRDILREGESLQRICFYISSFTVGETR